MHKNCILENWSESFFLCSFKNFQLSFLHLNPNPGSLGFIFRWGGEEKLPLPRSTSLVTGPSFISISSLVLEFWQFSFIRNWPDIRKSDITSSEICPISGDRGWLGIPNLARISLMKCYRMLQGYSFDPFWVIKVKPTGSVKLPLPPAPPSPHPPRLELILLFVLYKTERDTF